MKFEVNSSLHYNVEDNSTIILNIHALRTPNQTVVSESLTIEPYLKVEELNSLQGENRFARIVIPEATPLKIQYTAIVDNYFQKVDLGSQQHLPVSEFDPSIFPYLFPSRYCQSDKLFRFANKMFGGMSNPFEQVLAIVDWINSNVVYLSGSTNSETSAYDTVTELAGVCRDFAHVGIALCRALTIPARYFTGYAYQLNPPDFHACFEAYIGNRWILFDATKLAPLNGIIKIATGRDAADTAIASIFGNVQCESIQVECRAMEDTFQPFFYQENKHEALCYL